MDLFTQANSQGIQTEFLDGQGHRRVTDPAALKIILDALPPQAPGPLVGQPVVVRSGRPARTELRPTASLPVSWKIVADAGVVAEGEASGRLIDWPDGLPLGVHRLQLTDADAVTEDVPLISAPEQAFGGDFDRCWLVAVQLYGVRSARNWGIGDFTDLQGLIKFAGHLGADGVYVQMPFEALLAVTAQESVAQRCVVIGEDLGTVPEGFREQIADWGIWSYLVMMFERDDRGTFHGIDHYWTNALVTFNTHDLSTYAGWRSFGDLKTKRSLGIDPGESDDARWHALAMLDEVLRHHAIGRNDLYSVANFLTRTKSRLLAISLEDLLGVVEQPNIPGTVNEHPNWRRRLPVSIEQIASAVDVAALKAATHERSRAAV